VVDGCVCDEEGLIRFGFRLGSRSTLSVDTSGELFSQVEVCSLPSAVLVLFVC